MTLTRGRLIFLVVLLVCGAGGYWVYENLTWEEIHVPGMPRGEAARNNLLAAERLIVAMGGKAHSDHVFKALPEGDPQHAVLIFPTQRRTLTPRQRAQIYDWVERGGHLVAVTYTIAGDDAFPDELMERAGVRQFWSTPPKGKKPRKTGESGESDAGDASEDLADDIAPAKPRPRSVPAAKNASDCPLQRESGTLAPRFGTTPDATLKVCFDQRFRVKARGDVLWQAKDASGVHAIAVALGKGRVTVLTDYDFMLNNAIGRADHADFLLAMIGFKAGMNVSLIPREDVPGIVELAWRTGWPVLLALCAAILIALWRKAARLGPVVAQLETARRSIGEHVRASGEFLWRHGQAEALWKGTLEEVQRRIDLTLPVQHLRNPDDRLRLIEKRTGLGLARLQQAFFPQPSPRSDDFVRAIATLEHVRKSL
jgi:hypothetical protein